MAVRKAERAANRRHGRSPRNGEQLAELAYFNTATSIALQLKKIAICFGLSEAAAPALAPLVFGEGASDAFPI
jgi:hypothetical protein